MKILHVTLGNPYTHQGGLNQYCKELMETERAQGGETILLFPETASLLHKTRIVKRAGNYLIKNPLPVAITYGIDDPLRYMLKIDGKVYSNFLEEAKPDVIHVHSIQGIHKEFFLIAKEKKIPVVFTTHDYYPMCCKCNLLSFDNRQCEGANPEKCSACNDRTGLSAKKQVVIQSELYQEIKNTHLLRMLKRATGQQMQKDESAKSPIVSLAKCKEFDELIEYYKAIMSCITVIHANSELTGELYKKNFPDIPCIIEPITHNDIEKHVHARSDRSIIHFGYLGGMSKHKGYEQLLSACREMEKQQIKGWTIELYGGDFPKEIKSECIHPHGYFAEKEITEVWKNIDVLIVPSQCRETFGFAVMEGLSNGIPVVCSDLVGAKNLVLNIEPKNVYPYADNNYLKLRMMDFLDSNEYQKQTEAIAYMELHTDMKEHTKKIIDLYEKAIVEMRKAF